MRVRSCTIDRGEGRFVDRIDPAEVLYRPPPDEPFLVAEAPEKQVAAGGAQSPRRVHAVDADAPIGVGEPAGQDWEGVIGVLRAHPAEGLHHHGPYARVGVLESPTGGMPMRKGPKMGLRPPPPGKGGPS